MDWVSDNLNLFIGLVIVLLFIFKGKILGKVYGINSISVSQLQDELLQAQGEKLQLIDVRSPTEFKQNHIKNAINIPLSEINSKLLTKNLLSFDRPIYVICASGNRSLMATIGLKKMGVTNVHNVSGGMMMWKHSR